jgi:hypothetical protein
VTLLLSLLSLLLVLVAVDTLKPLSPSKLLLVPLVLLLPLLLPPASLDRLLPSPWPGWRWYKLPSVLSDAVNTPL